MVDSTGFELLTFPHISGVEGIRTLNLLRARQALSQLSYDPVNMRDVVPIELRTHFLFPRTNFIPKIINAIHKRTERPIPIGVLNSGCLSMKIL